VSTRRRRRSDACATSPKAGLLDVTARSGVVSDGRMQARDEAGELANLPDGGGTRGRRGRIRDITEPITCWRSRHSTHFWSSTLGSGFGFDRQTSGAASVNASMRASSAASVNASYLNS